MKKTVTYVSFLLLLIVTLGALLSCGEQHTHSFGEWTVVKDASCTNTGLRARYCTCGEKQEEIIPQTAHSFGEWTLVKAANCTNTGLRARYCTCGEKQEEIIVQNGVHDYEETIVKVATGTSSGQKKFVCKLCGSSYTEDYAAEKLTAEAIYALAEKTVVEILTYGKSGDGKALGSGFILGKDGRIVTNFHVIDDAYSINVSLGNRTYSVTQVLAYDEDIDLAILKVNTTFSTCVTLNKDLQPGGSPAYAVGSSEGYTLSFSSGSIASPDRVFSGVHYIQHSSPISHGNSGGPLFNAYGEVIGINTSSNIEGQNLNFAITVAELDNLPTGNSLTMKEFYDKEGPYFDIFIGDYVVNEIESNNSTSTAQYISKNGTTIDGSVNKATDVDYYKLYLGSGDTLTILMVPDMKIDNEGILCGLCDSNGEVIKAAIEMDYEGTALKMLTYTNTSSSTQAYYCVLVYSSSYTYKNTVGNYSLFFYAKNDN